MKKGLILELLQIQKSAGTIPWEKFAHMLPLPMLNSQHNRHVSCLLRLTPSVLHFLVYMGKVCTLQIASDVTQLEQKCNKAERQLRNNEYDYEKLEAKLRDYKPHNVKRRLERKIDRLAEQEEIIQQN